GSRGPIRPVEATNTCSAGRSSASPARAAMRRAWARPCAPVHALAQPLLTTIARARPRVARRCSRDTRIGAACTRFVVNTAAACVGPVCHFRRAFQWVRSVAALVSVGRLSVFPSGWVLSPLSLCSVVFCTDGVFVSVLGGGDQISLVDLNPLSVSPRSLSQVL